MLNLRLMLRPTQYTFLMMSNLIRKTGLIWVGFFNMVVLNNQYQTVARIPDFKRNMKSCRFLCDHVLMIAIAAVFIATLAARFTIFGNLWRWKFYLSNCPELLRLSPVLFGKICSFLRICGLVCRWNNPDGKCFCSTYKIMRHYGYISRWKDPQILWKWLLGNHTY